MQVKSGNAFPSKSHYAIIVFDITQVYHEGDERSRECPGHGYPAYTEEIEAFKYYAFESKTEWQKEIDDIVRANETASAYRKKSFKAFHVDAVATIKSQTVIDISI